MLSSMGILELYTHLSPRSPKGRAHLQQLDASDVLQLRARTQPGAVLGAVNLLGLFGPSVAALLGGWGGLMLTHAPAGAAAGALLGFCLALVAYIVSDVTIAVHQSLLPLRDDPSLNVLQLAYKHPESGGYYAMVRSRRPLIHADGQAIIVLAANRGDWAERLLLDLFP